jgi:hypothetical protein
MLTAFQLAAFWGLNLVILLKENSKWLKMFIFWASSCNISTVFLKILADSSTRF